MADTIADIKARLGFQNSGAIRIDPDDWPGPVGDAVKAAQPSGALVISAVQDTTDPDAAATMFSFIGRVDLLGQPGLTVQGRFQTDETHGAKMVLRIEPTSNGVGWTFRDTFKDLPSFRDLVGFDDSSLDSESTGPIVVQPHSVLDDLRYRSPAFLLSSGSGAGDAFFLDPVTRASLLPGLNFASHIVGTGFLGVLESALASLLTGDPDPILFGTIRIPTVTESIRTVDWPQFPWVVDPIPPGIHLQIGFDGAVLKDIPLLHSCQFHLYTPHADAWAGTDPAKLSYQPQLAYTMHFELPEGAHREGDAKPTVELSTELIPGYDRVLLRGLGEGLSIDRLANIAVLTGQTAHGKLPPELQDVLQRVEQAVGRIELEEIVLDIESTATAFDMRSARLRLGIPGEVMTLVKGLALENIGCILTVEDPLGQTGGPTLTAGAFATIVFARDPGGDSSKDVAVTVAVVEVPIGGFVRALDLETEDTHGWMIDGELTHKVDLHLDQILKAHAPAISDLSANPLSSTLSIDRIRVQALRGFFYSLQIELASSAALEVTIADQALKLNNIQAFVQYTEGEGAALHLSGTLSLGPATFAADLDFPGGFDVRAQVATFSMREAITHLTPLEPQEFLPEGFDLSFSDTVFIAKAQSGDGELSLGTTVKEFGTRLFLEVARHQGQWGFAFGADLETAAATNLKGLESLDQFVQAFGLQSFILFVSTLPQTSEQFGHFDAFGADGLEGAPLGIPRLGPTISNTGFFLFARFGPSPAMAPDSDVPGFRQLHCLANFLGIELDGSLTLALHVGLDPSKDTALLVVLEQLEIRTPRSPATAAAWGKLGGHLAIGLDDAGNPSINLVGSLATTIQGKHADFTVDVELLDNGVIVAGSLVGSLTFVGIELSDVGLMVGIDFEGIPSIGFTAGIDVHGLDASFGIMVNSAIPAQSFLLGSISDFSLRDIIEHVVKATHHDLPAEIDGVLDEIRLYGTDPLGRPGRSSEHPFRIPDIRQQVRANNLDAIVAALVAKGLQIASPSSSAPGHSPLRLHVPDKRTAAWFLTDLSSRIHYEGVFDEGLGDYAVKREAQVYVCPERTKIPGLTAFDSAYQVSGILSVFSFDVEANPLDFVPGKGFNANLTFPHVKLNDGKFLEISNADRTAGPQFQLCTFADGGATPGFRLSGRLYFLGIEMVNIDVAVKSSDKGKGIYIHIQAMETDETSFHLDGFMESRDDFGISGRAQVKFDNLHLSSLSATWKKPQILLLGTLDAGMRNGRLYASVSGKFLIAGADSGYLKADLPDLESGPLANLSAALRSEMENEMLGYLRTAKTRASEFFGSGMLLFEDDLQGFARALHSFWEFTIDEAPLVLKSVGAALTEIARLLRLVFADATSQNVLDAIHTIEQDLEILAQALVHAFPELEPDQLAKLLKGINDDADLVLQAMRSVFPGLDGPVAFAALIPFFGPLALLPLLAAAFKLSPGDIVGFGKTASLSATELGQLLGQIFPRLGPGGILAALQSVTSDPAALLEVLQALGIEEPIQIAQQLADAGCDPQAIANLMCAVLKVPTEIAAAALKSLGLPADAVNTLLQVAQFPINVVNEVVNTVLNPRTWNPENW